MRQTARQEEEPYKISHRETAGQDLLQTNSLR